MAPRDLKTTGFYFAIAAFSLPWLQRHRMMSPKLPSIFMKISNAMLIIAVAMSRAGWQVSCSLQFELGNLNAPDEKPDPCYLRPANTITVFKDHAKQLGYKEDELVILAQDSTLLDPQFFLNLNLPAFRLFSVDGGHSFNTTMSDMALATCLLHEKGVIVVRTSLRLIACYVKAARRFN